MALDDTPRSTRLNRILREWQENLNTGIRLFEAAREEVVSLQEAYQKLKDLCNRNGVIAVNADRKYRQLKSENFFLRNQLVQLQHARQQPANKELLPSSSTYSPVEVTIEGACPEGRNHRPLSLQCHSEGNLFRNVIPYFAKVSGSPEEDKCTTTSARPSKLSTNKQRKKVRYQELREHNTNGRSVPRLTPGSDIHLSRSEAQSGHHRNPSNPGASRRNSKPQPDSTSTISRSRIHVPETEMFTLDDGDGDDDGSGVSLGDESPGVDLEFKENLPEGMSLRSLKKSTHKLFPTVPETQLNESLAFSPIPSAVDQESVVHQHGDEEFTVQFRRPPIQSTPVRCAKEPPQKISKGGDLVSPLPSKGRLSSDGHIPPSESQLTVDFSPSQMSPTFCGGERVSTPGQQPTRDGSRRPNSLSGKPQTSTPQQSTSPDLGTKSNSKIKTPGYDESGQSEASFLILQPPPVVRRAVTQTRDVNVPSPSAPDQVSQRQIVLEGGAKRNLQNGETDRVANSAKRKREQEEAFVESRVPGKQSEYKNGPAVEGSRGNSSIGRVVEMEPPSQEKVQEKVLESLPPTTDQQNSGNAAIKPGRSSLSRSKSLVQAKLTANSFKAVTTPAGEQQRKYNGGARVLADSQDDPYIHLAIRESLLLAGKGDIDGIQDKDSGHFKVPALPRSRINSDKKNTSPLPLSNVVGKDHEIANVTGTDPVKPTADEPYEPDMFVPMEGSLNGSIDPAVELDFSDEDSDDNASTARSELCNERGEGVDVNRTCATSDNSNKCRSINDGKVQECHELEEDIPHFQDDSLADMFDDAEDAPGIKSGENLQEHDDGMGGASPHHREVQREQNSHRSAVPGTSFARHFDSVPRPDDVPSYKYKDVVRKRDDRQKLRGFDCKECAEYYAGLGLTAEEIALRTKNCSRHRGHYSPPSTPEHYWSIDFPNTETCLERGYIKENVEEQPRKKRKTKYRQHFTGARDNDNKLPP